MRFELTILGCNSAKPANGRHPTSQILNICEDLSLIDCGEGTQIQMNKFGVRRGRIQNIFISHLHGDHIFGLPGLLTSFSLDSRIDPLTIYAPKGLKKMVDTIIQTSGSHVDYPIHFVDVDTTRSYCVLENDDYAVYSIPLEHRIPTTGYLFREKKRLRHMLPEAIQAYEIPFTAIPTIKAGADYKLPDGRTIPNTELTSAPTPPRSYAYCSDTQYIESIIPIIQGVDLLYHEATYLHELLDRAIYSMHSTALQAAQIAAKAQVRQLILGHFSSRYQDATPLQEEARTVFTNSHIAEEGKVYNI